jgi:micrococcal nuclease
MRSLLLRLLLLFGFCSTPLAAEGPYGKVRLDEITSIYDGDTFRATIRGWPEVIGHRVPVRIAGIDTPELRDKRPAVRALALKAKQFSVQRLRSARHIELRNIHRDKYFRLLGDVWVDGSDLGAMLIRAGLAKPYEGGAKSLW